MKYKHTIYLFVLLLVATICKAQVSVSTTLTNVDVSGNPLQAGVALPLIKVATKADHSDGVLATAAKIPSGVPIFFYIEQQPGGQSIAEVHYWLTSNSQATLATMGKHTAPPFAANPITLATSIDRLVVLYWPQLIATSTANQTRLEVPFEAVSGGTLPAPGVSRNGNMFHAICGPQALDVVTAIPIPQGIVTGLVDLQGTNSILCTFKPLPSNQTEVDCTRNGTLCFPKVVVP